MNRATDYNEHRWHRNMGRTAVSDMGLLWLEVLMSRLLRERLDFIVKALGRGDKPRKKLGIKY